MNSTHVPIYGDQTPPRVLLLKPTLFLLKLLNKSQHTIFLSDKHHVFVQQNDLQYIVVSILSSRTKHKNYIVFLYYQYEIRCPTQKLTVKLI